MSALTLCEVEVDVLVWLRSGQRVRRLSLLRGNVEEAVLDEQLGDVFGLVDGRVLVEAQVVDADGDRVRAGLV